MLQHILRKNDYMTKVDLKDAYFMVPIGEKHRDLLKFKWEGKANQFNFQVIVGPPGSFPRSLGQ